MVGAVSLLFDRAWGFLLHWKNPSFCRSCQVLPRKRNTWFLNFPDRLSSMVSESSVEDSRISILENGFFSAQDPALGQRVQESRWCSWLLMLYFHWALMISFPWISVVSTCRGGQRRGLKFKEWS